MGLWATGSYDLAAGPDVYAHVDSTCRTALRMYRVHTISGLFIIVDISLLRRLSDLMALKPIQCCFFYQAIQLFKMLRFVRILYEQYPTAHGTHAPMQSMGI